MRCACTCVYGVSVCFSVNTLTLEVIASFSVICCIDYGFRAGLVQEG